MDGFQTLAWIVWRKRAAVLYFSGPEAQERWQQALRGDRLPIDRRHKRLVEPHDAECQLRAVMGHLLPYRVSLNVTRLRN